MDDAQEPLIPDELRDDGVEPRSDVPRRKPTEKAGPGLFVLLLTFAAGISGLLFGCRFSRPRRRQLGALPPRFQRSIANSSRADDTGVISGTLVSIGKALSNRELTSLDKSIITSATALFALAASPVSSLLADRLGRRRVILYADALFVSGAVLQAASSTVWLMVIGRCIIGAGVGAASFVVPLYIAEIAPAAHRGRLVTTNVMFITAGQVVAYVIGWLFATYAPPEMGWRWMVGLGAVPAAVQAVLISFMPETPRWLVNADRTEAARKVITQTQGAAADGEEVDSILKRIEDEASHEQEMRRRRGNLESGTPKWLGAWGLLLKEGKNRRALAIACLLQGLQQLCGFVRRTIYILHCHFPS